MEPVPDRIQAHGFLLGRQLVKASEYKQVIVEIIKVKSQIFDVDQGRLWPYHFPRVGATESDLSLAEASLGLRLDPQLRDFLRIADGWSGFFQVVDLFGTKELASTEVVARARALAAPALRGLNLPANQFLPIGASTDAIDVFGMALQVGASPVHWIAGEVVESYRDFTEFLVSMLGYNRSELERLADPNFAAELEKVLSPPASH